MKRIACFLAQKPVDPTQLTLFAEACLRFTPTIALSHNPLTQGRALLMEVGSVSSIYSEASLATRIPLLAKRFKIRCEQLTFASRADDALAMALYLPFQKTRRLESLPLEALLLYDHPFGQPTFDASHLKDKLHSLGVLSIAEFMEIPNRDLASRFGSGVSQLPMRVRGELARAWPVFQPQEKLLDTIDLEGSPYEDSADSLDPLLFMIRHSLDRLMARLRGRLERTTALTLSFQLERRSQLPTRHRHFDLKLPIPQGSTLGLLHILRDFLGHQLQARPLEAPVTQIQIEITDTCAGSGGQKHFFDPREDVQEQWQAVLGRITQELGPESVFRAELTQRFLPEQAWTRTLTPHAPKFPPPTTHHWLSQKQKWLRPSRVLRKPLPLMQLGTLLKDSGGRQWWVAQVEGPERLSGEWWNSHLDFYRDYFRILTRSGEKLWVFQDRGQMQMTATPAVASPLGARLFLQGFFD